MKYSFAPNPNNLENNINPPKTYSFALNSNKVSNSNNDICLFDNYLISNKLIFSHELNYNLSLPTYKSNYIIKNDLDDVTDNDENDDNDDDNNNNNNNNNDDNNNNNNNNDDDNNNDDKNNFIGNMYNKFQNILNNIPLNMFNNNSNTNMVNVEDVDSETDSEIDQEEKKECGEDNVNEDNVNDDDENNKYEYKEIEDSYIKIMKIQNKSEPNISYEPMQILHLNVPYLDENNDWIEGSDKFYQEYSSTNLDYLREKYMDERILSTGFDQKNKSNPNQIYRIISETCKSELNQGSYSSENKYYTSTTLLNQDKIYDGLTNIELYINHNEQNLFVSNDVNIENIQIRSRAKNKSIPNSYRNINWDLEFDLIPGGIRILGLDSFIHLNLVGLEEVFLDINYSIKSSSNNSLVNKISTSDISTSDIYMGDLASLNIDNIELERGHFQNEKINFELKYSRCIYNQTIKTNLEKFLYENEENYFVDIIDYLVDIYINLDKEEKIFGNMYNTNYNILRMMSGMGGLAYSS
jgi:hypothetical protein